MSGGLRGQAAAGAAAEPGASGAAPTAVGIVAMLWGAGGFVALLLVAAYRLSLLAVDSLDYDWSAVHHALLVVNTGVMAWFEGYRGFQRSYSPRLAARARFLLHRATPLQAALAPLVCMGFVNAPRRRMISTWLLTAGIVAVVLVYRSLPQPWRGILDAGVVVGLLWGAAATVYHVARAFAAGPVADAEMR